jgi:hypothetical protein
MPKLPMLSARLQGDLPHAVLAFGCAALALVAVALHAPGHVSVDSSIQLHEAITGRITSWAPPFMSALLFWLGLGTVGTSLFVALNAGATYGAYRLALGRTPGSSWVWWRWLLALAVIANPVVFAYVGIVWKDVLLASLCALSLGLSIAAMRVSGRARVGLAAMALVALLPIPLVRQQGFIMLPVFACSPAYLVASAGWRTTRGRRFAVAVVVAGLLLGYLGVRAAVEASFQKNASGSIYAAHGSDVDVGTRLIKLYDLAGIEARVDGGPLAARGAAPGDVAEVRRLYTASRIDTMDGPAVDAAFARVGGDALDPVWRDAIRTHPGAYLAHRFAAYSWLLGMRDPARCLPVHLGVAGIPSHLAESGFVAEQDARDSRLFSTLKPWMGSPLWRHWFYIALGLVLAVLVWRRGRDARWSLLPWIAGLAVFTAAYLPTTIACDFRYLYTLVPCAGLLVLALARPGRTGPVHTES